MPDAPDPKPAGRRTSRAVDSIVRAERLTQIAFILPVSVVIGWLGGAALDKWLHQHWIYLVGIIFGAVAGFVQIFRLISTTGKDVK